MRKVRFSDEGSPSKIPVRSREFDGTNPARTPEYKGIPTARMPESNDLTTTKMDHLRRSELDNDSIQATSPLSRIERRERSVPGIGSLYDIESTVTTAPAEFPRYKTNSKNKSTAAMEEDCRMRKEAPKDTASNFRPRGDSMQGVHSSPKHKAKPANIIIPMRPLRRTDSEETVVPTPVKISRFSDETIVQSPVETRRSSKDNGSPSLRKMRSAISILSLSHLTGLYRLPVQATSLLRAMCFFDPKDVRPRYLEAICARYLSKAGQMEVTLADFPTETTDLQSTINGLKRERLITSPPNALGLHVEDEVRQEVFKQLKSEVFEAGFKTVATVLYELWPSMMEPLKREVDFDEYAKHTLWGGRDELVIHVTALKNLFENAKGATMEVCATRRYMVLLVEVAWYHCERNEYWQADQFVDAAYQASKVACMVPKSVLANLHRTSAAIAFELGDTERVNSEIEQYMLLYPERLPQPRANARRTWSRGCPTADWACTENALLESGLLAAAPDGVGTSPWGLEEVEGFTSLAPFLSLRYFGWMNYADGRYNDAARCFLQCLGDHRRTFIWNDNIGPRRGELLYALGVVFKAQDKDEESFEYFKRALGVFERAEEDGPSKAKTHYKIALHHINMGDVDLADEHLEAAARFYKDAGTDNEYVPHLARLCFQCANIADVSGNDVGVTESLKKADEYLDKILPRHRRQQVGQAAMFDNQVVIWAR